MSRSDENGLRIEPIVVERRKAAATDEPLPEGRPTGRLGGEAQHALNAILTEVRTLGEATPRILRWLCQVTACDAGAMWLVDETDHRMGCVDFWHRPAMAIGRFESDTRRRRFGRGEDLPGRAWLTGDPMAVYDLVDEPSCLRARSAGKIGLASGCVFPIKLEERVLGVIECYSRQRRKLDLGLIDALATIGDKLGHFIRRVRTEDALMEQNASLEQRVANRTRALRDSEERLRVIVDAAAEGIISLDQRGRIQSMNPAALQMFGCALQEALGQDLSRFIVCPGGDRSERFLKWCVRGGARTPFGSPSELMGRHSTGSLIEIELRLTTFSHSGQRGFVALVHDIAERRRLEREMIEAGDRERQQMSQELHDDLGQVLHGVQFLATELQSRLERRGMAEAGEVGRLAAYLNEAIDQIRNLAHGLCPVPPIPEGLTSALRGLAGRIRRLYGLDCRFVCPKPTHIDDPNLSTQLFRIAQEAISNAVKHAGCKRIVVRLKSAPTGLMLAVSDDGNGRLSPPGQQGGMGLHIMRLRANTINASLTIQRRARRGTEIVCHVSRPFVSRPLGPPFQHPAFQNP
jgi:two-component system, LuxR family, sensor kinase FixL